MTRSISNNINVAEQIYFSSSNIFRWLKDKISSQNFTAFFVAMMLHTALLGALLLHYKHNINQSVLSFTITKMDVATSSNIVASLSAVKKQAAETLTAIDAQKNNDNSQVKSNSAQAFNSVERSAVLAPDSPAIFNAAYLNNEAPTYPPLSRRLEEQGTVILSVYVGVNGIAEKIEVNTGSGHERLDAAAFSAVKKWKFLAAKKGGEFTASWVSVPIRFVLEKS